MSTVNKCPQICLEIIEVKSSFQLQNLLENSPVLKCSSVSKSLSYSCLYIYEYTANRNYK